MLHVCAYYPGPGKLLKDDMEVDPGGCLACSGFASQLRNPNHFIRCPTFAPYSPGQPTNLLSALLSLSFIAVGYTNILIKIDRNKSW